MTGRRGVWFGILLAGVLVILLAVGGVVTIIVRSIMSAPYSGPFQYVDFASRVMRDGDSLTVTERVTPRDGEQLPESITVASEQTEPNISLLDEAKSQLGSERYINATVELADVRVDGRAARGGKKVRPADRSAVEITYRLGPRSDGRLIAMTGLAFEELAPDRVTTDATGAIGCLQPAVTARNRGDWVRSCDSLEHTVSVEGPPDPRYRDYGRAEEDVAAWVRVTFRD